MTRRDAWRRWAWTTAVSALAVTAIDAALLERKRAYFTGGFLSVDHVRSTGEALVFLAISWLSDAGAIAVPAAFVLWLGHRSGLPGRLGISLAIAAGAGPLLMADVVSYQILSYLGDAFDFGLMFDLVGRDPEEIVAVSADHLFRLAVAAGVVVVAAGAGLWWLVRIAWRHRAFIEPQSFFVWMRVPVASCLVAIVVVATARATHAVLDNGLRRKPSGQIVGALVRFVSDVDRDGFGLLGRPADPAAFDASIYPWAIDIPGNGVDENGVGGDLPAGSVGPSSALSAGAGSFAQTPDVIVIMIETLRADVVGTLNNGRAVTPVLDALAARGAKSERAFSHNGYTAQSRHSLFTGRLTPTGGQPSLIDDFNVNGYETAYFSAQDESFGGAALGSGFERAAMAFDARQDVANRYTTYTTPGSLGLTHRVLNGHIARFLAQRSPARPLFLYVNYYDLHFPYHHREIEPLLTPPVVLGQFEIAPARAAELRRMYLNTVANVDRAIGTLLDQVRRSTGREPVVVVLADHGESLFDEGFLGHGYALNDVQTRIPLVAAGLPLAIDEPFGQADVRPTLLRALQTPATPDTRPVLRSPPGRRVFQYLGLIERPAEIGFLSSAGRTVYDFRSDTVSLLGGPRQPASSLTGSEREAFLELVHAWEAMVQR